MQRRPLWSCPSPEQSVRLGCGQIGSTLMRPAAAKVMNFDKLGKKIRPGTFFLEYKNKSTEVPKKSLCQKT